MNFIKKINVVAEAESECRLLAVQIDCGDEFNSNAFREFCEETGAKHNTNTPESPQQNGVVERQNQTIVEISRCLMNSMATPRS